MAKNPHAPHKNLADKIAHRLQSGLPSMLLLQHFSGRDTPPTEGEFEAFLKENGFERQCTAEDMLRAWHFDNHAESMGSLILFQIISNDPKHPLSKQSLYSQPPTLALAIQLLADWRKQHAQRYMQPFDEAACRKDFAAGSRRVQHTGWFLSGTYAHYETEDAYVHARYTRWQHEHAVLDYTAAELLVEMETAKTWGFFPYNDPR